MGVVYRTTFLVLLAVVVSPLLSTHATAEGKHRKLLIHVNENEPSKMNMALNIAEQVTAEWKKQGDTVRIDIVVHGPGLHMLRADTSPVKKRIGLITTKQDNLTFSACGNTMKNHAKKLGGAVPLIPEATVVTAAVTHIMELQDQGYNYIRP